MWPLSQHKIESGSPKVPAIFDLYRELGNDGKRPTSIVDFYFNRHNCNKGRFCMEELIIHIEV